MTPADKARIEEIREREVQIERFREWMRSAFRENHCMNEWQLAAVQFLEERDKFQNTVELQARMIKRAKETLEEYAEMEERRSKSTPSITSHARSVLADLDRMERGE